MLDFKICNAGGCVALLADKTEHLKGAGALSDRAVNLVRACQAGQLLPRRAQDETWFECNFCDWRQHCRTAQ